MSNIFQPEKLRGKPINWTLIFTKKVFLLQTPDLVNRSYMAIKTSPKKSDTALGAVHILRHQTKGGGPFVKI